MISRVAVGWLTVLSLTACSSEGGGSGGPGTGGASSGGSATGGTSTGGTSSGGAGAMGGSAPDASPDAPACTLTKPYSSKNTGCNACAEQKCCALVNACLDDPACDDGYVNCILACALDPGDGGDAGVATCIAACDAQYPVGKAEYDAAIGCAESKCATECQ